MTVKEILFHPYASLVVKRFSPEEKGKVAASWEEKITYHRRKLFSSQNFLGKQWHYLRGLQLSEAADIVDPIPNSEK